MPQGTDVLAPLLLGLETDKGLAPSAALWRGFIS